MNIFTRLLNLLPKPSKELAVVVSQDSIGRYTLSLPGGGVITARGPDGYLADDKVYVENGVITSKATQLPFVEIEI